MRCQKNEARAMSKEKELPRDYNADLRLEPLPDESVTAKELMERAHHFVKDVLLRGEAERQSLARVSPSLGHYSI